MDGLDGGPTRHKLDVSEYGRMGAAGVFADNKRIELIDGALIDMAPIGYAGRRPTAADGLLLVEVADSSLRFDRTVKLPLYARFGIAEVWIVDVSRRAVDVHRNPSDTGYDDVVSYPGTGELALAAAPDIIVRLDLVFGAML